MTNEIENRDRRIAELEADLANAIRRIEVEQSIYGKRIAELEAQTLTISRLRRAIVRYGDRARMSNAPPDLQQSIDEAFSFEGEANDQT